MQWSMRPRQVLTALATMLTGPQPLPPLADRDSAVALDDHDRAGGGAPPQAP